MSIYQDSSDIELLKSIQAGDEHAFRQLFRRRQAALYRFAIQMGGSEELAEDITQEVFLVLIRDTQTFDPARGSLNAFLYGIARNLLLRRLERERFYGELDSDAGETDMLQDPTSGPLEDFLRSETVESVRKAVLSLPERYREVVVLCELEEMSYVEAAEILGCAIGTVRSRLHRARAILIEKLRPDTEKSADNVKSARCFA